MAFQVCLFRRYRDRDHRLGLSAKPQATIARGTRALLFFGFWFLVSILYFLFFGFLAFAAGGERETIFDPLRIQRILIPADRAPAELERVKQGTLVQMSRRQFEELAQRAAQRLDAAQNPPRLVETRYQATLTATALVGRSRWRIVNPTPIPGVVPLQPWNLALVKARWPKGRADFVPALIADWKGQGPGLLVDRPGERGLDLDWTVRGDPGPAGLHFDIQVPASPLASLELNLPSDQAIVSESDAYLVSGPAPADQEGRNLWRIEFAGQSKLDLMIRPRSDGPVTLPILSQVSATYDVRPDLVQVDFELKLEVSRQPIQRPLVFEFDPTLRPVEVSASDLESWELTSPSRLQVRWRRPFQGGSLQIRCLAPLAANQVWQFPRLDLEGAVPRGETILLRISAEMQMKSWQSGAFRLGGNEITSDGGQILTLSGINLSPDAVRHRPRVEFQAASASYRVRQLAWWKVGPTGSSLSEQLVYEVTKGRLRQLQLQLPLGWEVERAELTPANLARTQTIIQRDGGNILSIDLQQPLIAGQSTSDGPGGVAAPARLILALRPVPSDLTAQTALPFPDLIPVGARFREGSFAISVDPLLQARVVGARAEVLEDEKGPWGKQPPDFFFTHRGQGISGLLELKPRHVQFQAQTISEVTILSDRASQVTRLAVKPREGKPRSLFVHFSAPLPKKCVWRTTAGRGEVQIARRLSSGEFQSLLVCLAAPYSLPAATLLPWTPHGELWQLILDRPLQGPLTLETTLDLPGRLTGGPAPALAGKPSNKSEIGNDGTVHWDLPLPIVLQAGVLEGKVIVHSDPAGQFQIESAGLAAENDQAPNMGPKKTYRYGSGPRNLILRGPRSTAERALDPVLAGEIQLETTLDFQGRQVCRLAFEISGWPQKSLPIRLPPGARPVGALIAGKWVSHVEWEEGNGAPQVFLPVPSSGNRLQVELIYEIDEPSWIFWSTVSLPLPELPLAEPPPFVRTCRLPPGVAPLNGRFWRLTGSSTISSPLLLDDPLPGWTLLRFQGQMPINVRLVRPNIFLGIGYGLGLALLLAGLRYQLARSRWFLLGSASAMMLFLLLPSGLQGLAFGPILAVLALAGIALFELVRTQVWGRTPAKTATATVLGITAFLGTTAISAQVGPFRLTPKPPIPAVPVYLIPGPAEAPEQQTVLIAPEALEKLRNQAGHGAVSPVLLDSRYDGKVEETRAEFRADWTAFNPGDGPGRLMIPLSGVQLQDALVDGARGEHDVLWTSEPGGVNPRSGAAGREGYAIDLKGRGFHTVQFRFVTAVQESGDARDIQFHIPELAQNRLTLMAPAGARSLYAPGGRGRQQLTPLGGPETDKGVRLEADLGQVGSIHLRWQQAAGGLAGSAKEPSATLDIREAYLWDLRPAGSTLLAVLQCVVKQGAVSSLEVALPDPFEVRHDPTVSQAARPGEPAPRLKEWRVIGSGKDRRLHIEFQRPISGRFQIVLELVPRIALGSVVDLPLPSPFGDSVVRQSVADSLSFVAFRTEDLHAQIANHLRITGIEANDFRDFWVAAGLPDPGPETHAFSFQRNPGNPPVLKLQLLNPDPGRTAWQDIRWVVNPWQAEFAAKIHLTAPSRELALVECDIPNALNITDVTGPEVYAWSQIPAASAATNHSGDKNSRLQVWLKGMFADTTLELTGWTKLEETPANQAAPAPAAKPPQPSPTPNVQQTNDRYLFPLPAIRLLSAADQRISIQVETGPEWELKLIGRKNMWSPPSSAPARAASSPTGEGGTLEEFLTEHPDYEGTFQLLRTPRPDRSNPAKP